MINKGRGLGRGLGALLPTQSQANEEKPDIAATATERGSSAGEEQKNKISDINDTGEHITSIPIMRLWPNKNQPRSVFDEEALNELADSIKEHGILQPLIVRKIGSAGSFEIIAGERRFRAAKIAGLKEIPAIIRDYSMEKLTEIALIENLQRKDLSVIEEARAYSSLVKMYQLTQEDISKKIGRSRSHIANILRLLALPDRVQQGILDNVITMGQSRPLLALGDEALMQKAADYIVKNNLSARESEELVAKLKNNPALLDEDGGKSQKAKAEPPRDVHIVDAEERIQKYLGAKVRILPIPKGKKKSRIEIEYYSEDDLTRILEMLGGEKPIPAADEIDNSDDGDISHKKDLLREASRKFTI